ncbi:hypothetical protein SUGI_0645000 [Cryptomeria japonica]|uniref:fatty acid desaturase 4-like 1, chloroplastic n=1 Tax=Cryptomeria japonica TaxID=3369 RepID=UPI0024149C4F|nr:fatty acid desaturase 4-like 1, chloroplastic [Cryptomeria japonica]GLJ32025.1 hypothetical protein SUGI_0645000 [Cryptomeria japonica]
MATIGSANAMSLTRPLHKLGTSIHFISIKSPHRPICKFSIILKSSSHRSITCSVSTKPKAVTQSAQSYSNGQEMGLSDSSLESTFTHRLWVTIGCGALVALSIKSIIAMDSTESILAGLLSAYMGYMFADLGTGIYHWGIDNYGDANTPIFGPQIDAFQGHHKRPWTITRRQFANNIHALARPASFLLMGFFFLVPDNPALLSFLGVGTGCIVFSQQFHCWAHCKKSELPALVIQLQDLGVLVSRVRHGAHHRAPYDNNYCIVSGMWNPLLDSTKFFKKMEMFIYLKWGVRPRCWDETAAEWLQDGSYFDDGSNELL